MKIALLTAGGTGSRMQQEVPKQFIHVNDKPIIVYTMEAFQKHPDIDAICVACLDGWENVLAAYARQYKIDKLKYIVPAGETGQASIYNGLVELDKHYSHEDMVLVHDGVRPMLSQEIISDCIVVAEKYGCGIASIPTVEAVLYSEDKHASTEFYDRAKLQRTQTPHGFTLGHLLDLHAKAAEKSITNTVASCTLAIELGEEVYFSLGSEKNLKITTMDDLDIFKALLAAEDAKK